MLGVEPRAFIVISAAFGALWAFIFFILHASFPREIRGLSRWGTGCVMMAAAALLFAASGALPVLLSSYLANLLVAGGVVAMHGSVRRFGGLRRHDPRMFLVLALTALALASATFVHDDYRTRVVVMSSVLTGLFGACAYAILQFRFKGFAERYTACVFAATASIMLVRSLTAIAHGPGMTRVDTNSSLIHQIYMATFSFSLVALSVGFLLMVNRRLHRKLESLAMRDKQTGVYRREAILALLEREFAESKSEKRSMSVLMIDIDNFKAINDQHGHACGDRIISDFSSKAREVLRRQDAIGRYGGDEFLVLAPDTSAEGARAMAGRLLAATAEVRRADTPPYTVSIGIARLETKCEDAGAIIDAADRALYAAKKAGRNCVQVAPGPSETLEESQP